MAKRPGAAVHIRDELDEYIASHSLRLHPAQKKLIQATEKISKSFMISHPQSIQLQQNLAKAIGTKKALEIGTFTGYGAVSIALILPEDGRVIAMDVSEEWANIGRPFWKEAGVEHKIDLRIAPATETLRIPYSEHIAEKLLDTGESGTFDYAFIDADKDNYDAYYEMSLKLVRSGGLIIIDNTLWNSQVLLEESKADWRAAYVKALNDKIAKDSRVRVSLLRLGDGVTICFKE